MESNKSERAQVRVPAFFKVALKRLDDPGDVEKEIEHHRTCDRFGTPPTAFSDLPSDLDDLGDFQDMEPAIYKMWMSMERKLDAIIRYLNRDVFIAPDMESYFCVNLSAGGIRIKSESAFESGAIYLIRMIPPTFPALIVEATAKVAYLEKDSVEESHFIVSFEFRAINQIDKEDLISFLFKRQREILRSTGSDT